MISINKIESQANKLVKQFNSGSTKVDVKNIAGKLNLTVKPHDLGDNVSGVLYVSNGLGIIGYNSNQSMARRRFTISHEIGHYILHRLENNIFIDNPEFGALYRSEKSSMENIQQEREANAFAAALLMPKDHIYEAINKLPFDLSSEYDKSILHLSKLFGVSTMAMNIRLSNLNLFW